MSLNRICEKSDCRNDFSCQSNYLTTSDKLALSPKVAEAKVLKVKEGKLTTLKGRDPNTRKHSSSTQPPLLIKFKLVKVFSKTKPPEDVRFKRRLTIAYPKGCLTKSLKVVYFHSVNKVSFQSIFRSTAKSVRKELEFSSRRSISKSMLLMLQ